MPPSECPAATLASRNSEKCFGFGFFLLLLYNQRDTYIHLPSEKLELSLEGFYEVSMKSSILVSRAPTIELVNGKSFLSVCLFHYTVKRFIKECELQYPSTRLNNQHEKNRF